MGMRVVTKAVAPAALPPPPGTARWYWQESAPRLHTHANLKPPHWVPYDASTSAAIEEAFQNGLYHILLGTAPRQYAVYPKRMKQVNEATAFEQDLLREETAARPTDVGGRAPAAGHGAPGRESCRSRGRATMGLRSLTLGGAGRAAGPRAQFS